MFCPQCGSTQSDEVKFCKVCGANLFAVRQAVVTREIGDKFDWSKTWVAEMFMSEAERKRRQAEIELQAGITPEVKRYAEIKGGVITSCVGIGIGLFLYIFMTGIVLSGRVDAGTAQILTRLWISGVIPFFVGVGLLINGLVVSKHLEERRKLELETRKTTSQIGKGTPERLFPEANEPVDQLHSHPSVTEGTTMHLKGSD